MNFPHLKRVSTHRSHLRSLNIDVEPEVPQIFNLLVLFPPRSGVQVPRVGPRTQLWHHISIKQNTRISNTRRIGRN